MKRFFGILLILTLVFLCICTVASAKDIEIYMLGKKIQCDVAPFAENGRTLVPIRAVSEEGLGADVQWDGSTQRVTITKDGLEIVLTLGNEKVTVNGKDKFLDVPAKAVAGRTMVPVRFISEELNYNVEWDGANNRVVIEEKEKNRITKIDVEKTNNDNLLNVGIENYIEPSIFVLKNPYRIVVDIKDSIFDDVDGKTDVNSGFIKQVRWAKHDGYYRIVVECQGESQPYKLVQTGKSSFSVIVGNPNTKVDISKPVVDEEDNKNEVTTKPADGKMLVVIDAGHGGSDPGALAKDENSEVLYDDDGEILLKEKDVNLSVALKVNKHLENAGVNVMMTRSKDEYLELRKIADIANEAKASLFVSIHSNSVDGIPGANGTEVLYFDTDGKSEYGITSKELADNILDEVISATDMFDRGLKERPGLAVLKWTEMPAALVEMGFITNSGDRKKMTNFDWQEKMAKAIADGIVESISKLEKAKK